MQNSARIQIEFFYTERRKNVTRDELVYRFPNIYKLSQGTKVSIRRSYSKRFCELSPADQIALQAAFGGIRFKEEYKHYWDRVLFAASIAFRFEEVKQKRSLPAMIGEKCRDEKLADSNAMMHRLSKLLVKNPRNWRTFCMELNSIINILAQKYGAPDPVELFRDLLYWDGSNPTAKEKWQTIISKKMYGNFNKIKK